MITETTQGIKNFVAQEDISTAAEIMWQISAKAIQCILN